MKITKENIDFYKYILSNSSSKKEIIFYMLKRAVGIKAMFNQDVIIESNGFYINCGRIMENCKTASEVFEDVITNAINELADGHCIDVGANIGKHTILMASKAKKVWAFEPLKDNLRLLRDNIRRNVRTDKVVVYPIAVSDEKRITKIMFDETHPANASLFLDHESSQEIQTDTLDNVLGFLSNVKLIKIDVEGSEVNVIKGAKKLIAKNKPYIIFEAWNFGMAINVAKELEGYEFYQLDKYNYLAKPI